MVNRTFKSYCHRMLLNPAFTIMLQNVDLSPVLELLIANGVEIDQQSSHELYQPDGDKLPKGMTPLMIAINQGRDDYARILVKHAAKKGIRDDAGLTAYDYAVKVNASDEIKSLVK